MSLQIIISADVEPVFQGIPDPPAVPPAPPLPANLQFRPMYSDMKAFKLSNNYDSDNDSGRGESMLFITDLPGLNLSDDEFSEEFSNAGSATSSRRASSSLQGSIPTPPPPPPLPQVRPLLLIEESLLPARQWNRNSMTLPRGLRPSYSFDSMYSWDDDVQQALDIEPIEPIDYSHKEDCIVCYDTVYGKTQQRTCCKKSVCSACLSAIINTNIEEGRFFISCPNPECEKGAINRDEVLQFTNGRVKNLYEKMRLEAENSDSKKACPNCCHITEHKLPSRARRFREEKVRITCEKCSHDWCFRCHAPWHDKLSCRQFKKGDKQFSKWTKGRAHNGIANCQKCPLCQVYIQRSTGCDHMTCNRCDTEFCYKCGDRFLEFPGLGDHYSQTGIFGCKQNYHADQPVKRVTIRGGYFGAKIAMLTGYPILFVAGVAVVVVVGTVALPIYGGYKLYKFTKNTRKNRARRRQ